MWRLSLLSLVACGRLGFDPAFDKNGDARTGDAPPDACALGPWSAPTRVTSLATVSDDYGPASSLDGQTLVFTSNRAGGPGAEDLYVAFRTGPLQFGPATELTMFNSTVNDYGGTWVGPDELYFSSDAGAGPQIYSTMFANQTFGTATAIPELATFKGASVTGDGLEMYFNTSGNTTLGHATRPSRTASWTVETTSTPVLDGAGGASYSSVAKDGLSIFFQSSRSGSQHLYSATRPDRQSAFSPPTLVTEAVNTASAEGDADISADGTTLLFGSTRNGGSGGYDIYALTRSCL